MRVPTARSITDIPGREKTQARGVRRVADHLTRMDFISKTA